MAGKTVAYVRVSTDKQVESGASLAAQRTKIEAYCQFKGLDLIEIISDDGISAKNLNRPGMQRILDMASKKQIENIVIWKLDRMFRNTINTLETINLFEKKGINFHSICENIDTQTATGRFFLTMLAALGEMERGLIGERTKVAMAEKKAEGKVVGTVPYGYDRIGNNLVENDLEQKTLAHIRELRDAGIGYQKIADTLNSEGISAKHGGQWSRAQIFKILKKAA